MDPAEDEAALLAELRAISNKSASAGRFASSSSEDNDGGGDDDDGTFPTPPPAAVNDDGNENDGGGANISSATTSSSAAGIQNTDQHFQDEKTASPEPSTALGNDVTGAGGITNVTETEASPSPSPSPSSQSSPPPNKDENVNTTITTDHGTEKAVDGGGLNRNVQQPSTFSGDRGGDAFEAELLAELRGISNKSNATDRFAGGEGGDGDGVEDGNNNNNNTGGTVTKPNQAAKMMPTSEPVKPNPVETTAPKVPTQKSRSSQAADKPWKRAKAAGAAKKVPSSTTGDDFEIVVAAPTAPTTTAVTATGADESPAASTPPPTTTQDVDVHVPAATTETTKEPETLRTNDEVLGRGGGNFSTGSTFQGERGGDAQDAELLALLRGVSANSGASNRFGGEEGNGSPANNENSMAIPPTTTATANTTVTTSQVESDVGNVKSSSSPSQTRPQTKSRTGGVPPWKRGRNVKKPTESSNILDVEISVASPNTKPTTLTTATPVDAPVVAERPTSSTNDVLPTMNSNSTEGFRQKSTFQGERGGDANDAELLALLRGVSVKNTSENRFSEDVDGAQLSNTKDTTEKASIDASVPVAKQDASSQPANPPVDNTTGNTASQVEDTPAVEPGRGNFQQSSTFQGERGGEARDDELLALLRQAGTKQPSVPASSGPPSMFPDGEPEEVVVTKEDLPASFSDKNWKVRKAAYQLLANILQDASKVNEPGTLDGDSIVSGLDGIIHTILAEKNAVALEFAVQAATYYADTCTGGSSSEQAETIVASLVKGNAFSSPRPSCVKATSNLVLKVMEVGSDKTSLLVVASHLLQHGVSSKKAKVVQLSTSLILETALSFGAALLPLKPVADALPKILSHSNKKIRDVGLEILAELCRALGSKAPLEPVIGKMQKAQVKELDALLSKQPGATPSKIGLRCLSASSSGLNENEDALAALQAGGEELERERYLARPAEDVLEKLKKTEYSSKLKLAKWSEKVGALSIVLECGGEKPYKLVQPSSSVNYTPLISDMKGLLKHTHFLVVSKALEVLSMLADGVGEKLFPTLRPVLPKLFELSKDKKLTKAVASCLDSFFGNILSYENILDGDSAIPDATDESKQKNALARASSLEFLDRAVTRGTAAGPRASLTAHNSKSCAKLAAEKLNDSDATVRKAALQVLVSLQKIDDPNINEAVSSVVEKLQQSNPRAYKSLSKGGQPKIASRAGPKSPNKTERQDTASPIPAKRPAAAKKPEAVKSVPAKPAPSRETARQNPFASTIAEDSNLPSEEIAVSYCQSLNIDNWKEPEDDGGVLSGLKSTKWQSRHAAIKKLALFVECRPLLESPSDAESDTTFLLVLVREHTRGFKETNMNVSRSILEFFISLCDYHERVVWPFPKWAIADVTALAVEKVADRKLSALSKSLLLELCVTHPPPVVVTSACENASSLKAPVAHEEFLVWMKTYLNQFGAQSIGSASPDIVKFLIEECSSKNIKVKRAAFTAIGLLHAHIGPSMKAIVLANVKDPSFRQEVEKSFIDHPFDPSLSKEGWPKACLVLSTNTSASEPNASCSIPGETTDMVFDLPKTDLIAELPADCLSRMGANDSKTAWKLRKAALEDVEKVLKGSTGVLDTMKLRGMIDLLRAMRERLSDSQSNLKPLAARLIGDILGSVEGEEQGKLGKIVYGPLINAAMNDNRKIMHDASMGALQKGTSIPSVVGDGINTQSLEPFIIALSLQLDDSEFKSAGISEVLSLTESLAPHLPNLDNVASNRGETLGGRFARVLVDALSSPKAEIRSAAESLLSECLQREVFNIQTAKKCTVRLVPAKQRSVGMILAKIASDQKNNDSNISTMDDQDNEIDARIASRASTQQIQGRNRTNSSKIAAEPRLNSKVNKHASSNRQGNSKATTRQDEVLPRHNKEVDAISRDISSTNPLVYESDPIGLQKSRSALRSLTWPEYPEEPSGSALYNGLKKAWSPIIPPESTKALFPDGGVRKQDDFMKGFEVIARATAMEQAGEGMAVTEQLTFILRWSVFVMCSRESTVGLTGLLEMLAELVHFLLQSKHELSDSDAMTFVPYVFEKAGTAKGRFVDMYMDLIRSLKSGHLLPSNRLGPSVCVALMESSPHAKARLLACQECYACIETANLSGIGKKGVIVAAKNFSEEKLPENKAAFMELMVLIASRMNNDMNKLAKICGSSLSSRARKSLEEKVARGGDSGIFSSGKASSPSKARRNDGTAARPSSRLPNSNQSTPASKVPPSRFKAVSHEDSTMEQTSFKDELPALDLRTELPKSPPMGRKLPLGSSTYDASPLPSSLPRLSHIQDGSDEDRTTRAMDFETNVGNSDRSSLATNLFKSSTDFRSQQSADNWRAPSALSSASSDSEEAAGGAAASLRARLMKIKEKNKTTVPNANTQSANLQEMLSRSQHEPPEPQFVRENTYSSGSSSLIAQDVMGPSSLQASTSADMEPEAPILTGILEGIHGMLGRARPIPPEDPGIEEVGNMLTNIHAAATNLPINAHELDESQIAYLRQEIKENISDVVTSLTKIMEFGLQCHPSTFNLGLSTNLLSVNMASLMSLFRDKDIADLVNVDDLTILIRESGRALLDPRLAPPSAAGTPGESTTQRLDETASTQMVRAINKLAVQVATGAKVETSVQALITLQEQLCLNNDQNDDKMFNTRLARIVTKLFGRVIKVERGSPEGFSAARIDTEMIICCLEDTLVKSHQDEKAGNHEGAASIRNLARLLVVAILESRRESSTFRLAMDELDIDPTSSALGALVQEVVAELGIQDISTNGEGEQTVAKVDVSSLVTAVGSAENEQDREAALSALKQYKATNGDEDLNSHLAEVSSTFRSFVLEQLSGSSGHTAAVSASTVISTATPVGHATGTTHGSRGPVTRTDASNGAGTSSNITSSSMSDRIKSLRSKLSATEAAMQKIEPVQQQQQQQHQQQKENKHFSQQKTVMEKTDTAKAFRDRLAAAQEKQRLTAATNNASSSSFSSSSGIGGSNRVDAAVGVGFGVGVGVGGGGGDTAAAMSPVPQTSAGSRAAALRARLQAVKQKNTGEEF